MKEIDWKVRLKSAQTETVRRLREKLAGVEGELDSALQREKQWCELESRLRFASRKQHAQSYGDLTRLNTHRLILDAVGPDVLREIANCYLSLLETSSALYEKNGDYAMGLFTSGWCRLLDNASRRLCGTKDNRKALACGKWHCHESCWTEASKISVETGQNVDIECRGGIRLYAIPIRAGEEIVGSINFGYGDPPKDPNKLKSIARRYDVSISDLRTKANAYWSRTPLIVAVAKEQLEIAARLIGEIVVRKRAEEALRRAQEELETKVRQKTAFFAEVNRKLEAEIVQRRQAEAELRANEAAVEEYRDQLRSMTARLLNASEDEHRRLARELHDDLGQRAAALGVELGILERKIPPRCLDVKDEVRILHGRLEGLSDQIRQKAHQLHPAILDLLGLAAALESYCSDFSELEKIRVKFTHRSVPTSLPKDAALNLYRIAQESMRNVSRHAEAKSISVSLTGGKNGLLLSIKDSGVGFDPASVRGKKSLGLISMEERTRMLGGILAIKSRPGQGTQIAVRVPLRRYGKQELP
jgi:signal transduction histidine kinase